MNILSTTNRWLSFTITCGKKQTFVVGRLNSLGVPKYVHTDDAICSWMNVGDDSFRSMEWCCVVFPQQEKSLG